MAECPFFSHYVCLSIWLSIYIMAKIQDLENYVCVLPPAKGFCWTCHGLSAVKSLRRASSTGERWEFLFNCLSSAESLSRAGGRPRFDVWRDTSARPRELQLRPGGSPHAQREYPGFQHYHQTGAPPRRHHCILCGMDRHSDLWIHIQAWQKYESVHNQRARICKSNNSLLNNYVYHKCQKIKREPSCRKIYYTL